MDRDARRRMPAWKARFEQCRSAGEILGLKDELSEAEGYVFEDFVRDATIAAVFARARGLEIVRLHPDRWPDFILSNGGQDQLFEATEADYPGRRRDAEYRQAAELDPAGRSACRPDPIEDWLTAEAAAEMLERAARTKVKKHYSLGASLVIYLNASEYGIRHQEIVDTMTDSTAVAKDAFVSVWVLWKGQAFETWNSGVIPRMVRA